MELWLAKEVKEVENGTRGAAGAETIDAYWERGRKRIQERVAIRDRMLNDLELNAKAMGELKRHQSNLNVLSHHG